MASPSTPPSTPAPSSPAVDISPHAPALAVLEG